MSDPRPDYEVVDHYEEHELHTEYDAQCSECYKELSEANKEVENAYTPRQGFIKRVCF